MRIFVPTPILLVLAATCFLGMSPFMTIYVVGTVQNVLVPFAVLALLCCAGYCIAVVLSRVGLGENALGVTIVVVAVILAIFWRVTTAADPMQELGGVGNALTLFAPIVGAVISGRRG